MSAEFWAGYVSGTIGIVVGNPLDVLKVRLQAAQKPETPTPTGTTGAAAAAPRIRSSNLPSRTQYHLRPLLTGAMAPILGYGALNALLFVTYSRAETALDQLSLCRRGTADHGRATNLYATWLAGATGGLATWVVSTPTEIVKCRAQLALPPATASSWAMTRQIWRTEGAVRGLYFGGTVTALRDSVGYGFYFWSYALATRFFVGIGTPRGVDDTGFRSQEAAKILLCGGLAGIMTWASVFPLDVIKTRVQAQVLPARPSETRPSERKPLAGAMRHNSPKQRRGAWAVARELYSEGGIRPFYRGLMVCSIRAFMVNAVQWAVFECIMAELGQGRGKQLKMKAEPVAT